MSCRLGEFHLNGITMEAREGRILAVAGTNGAGKSTLMKAICGNVRTLEGEIRINGTDLRSMRQRDKATLISYLPQEIPRPFNFTVTDIMKTSRIYMDQDMGVLKKSLETCGAAHLVNRNFESLSGGEKRIVMLATMIYRGSRVILLDEPTTFLDIDKQIRITGILRELRKKGYTILVAIHDLRFITREADDLLLMRDGETVSFGDRRNTATRENLETTFGIRLLDPATHGGDFIPEYYGEDYLESHNPGDASGE
ncbi:MAG: ABC transporter ATP-binding protein [Candidatus Thermoplasmatota archaeon]|nr:ABC transporter ATP-binding protein [Candidatus Thermoplasmatota archaeon]